MSTTVPVPTGWPDGVPARPGLPPRNAIARGLDAQVMWLASTRRHRIYIPLARGYDDQLTDSEAGSSSPEMIRVRIPPWTAYVRWHVLAERDNSEPTTSVQRIEIDGSSSSETYYHTMATAGPGGDYLPVAALLSSLGVATASGGAEDIHAGSAGAAWHTITIKLWLDDAEIYGVALECLPEETVTA